SLGIIVNAIFIVIDFYFLSISTREKGMSDNSNYAAMSMALAAQYFVYRIIKNRFAIFNLSNLFYLAVIGYLFFAVLATGSRTGFILFVFSAGLLIMLLTNWATKLRLIPFAIVVGGFVVLNSGIIELTEKSATFNRLTTATEDVRVPLFKAGMNALEDSWYMGIGIAQMIDGKTFAKYIAPVDPVFLAEVESRGKGLGLHNLYLEVAVEAGMIGLITFLTWLFFIFKHQVTMLRYKPRQGEHTLLLILFIAVLITGLTGKGLLGALFWMMYTLSSKYYIETEYDLSNPENPVRIKKH
ncbi:MAG: O-antigen ligase family protein, partial [Phaeodactylibacter sp.]|nr:O-antigen ligase family protein [Phaeodactylibacter sp.]